MQRILAALRRVDAALILSAGTLTGVLCSFAAPLLRTCPDASCTLLDLTAHWLWLYLPVALWLLARTDGITRKMAIVAAILAAGRLSGQYTSYPEALVANNEPALRVVQANVHVNNRDPKPFLAWLKERKPDVVVVQEVSPAWGPVLETLPEYPYHKVVPSTDSFGIAILSKHPFESVTSAEPGSDTLSLDARIRWLGSTVRLIAVHPIPPLTPHLSARRDARLAKLANIAAIDKMPTLLVGDFNATPWSAGGAAVTQSGLHFAAPLTPTWPTVFGPFTLLPLDHVAFNARWAAVAHERGPDIGSDHFPVEASLKLVAPAPASTQVPVAVTGDVAAKKMEADKKAATALTAVTTFVRAAAH